MKLLIASDSFKGTLSSLDICDLFQNALKDYPNISLIPLPIADGGEGSLDTISAALSGTTYSVRVNGPLLNKMSVKYFIDEHNNAYIETASSAGLPLLKTLAPLESSTYGLGEQINDALKKGAKSVYLFLGGSATTDGGTGLFSALGTNFYHHGGDAFIPAGGTLLHIHYIDNSAVTKLLKDVPLIALTDVNNPLYGQNGAAYVYGPQKGADDNEVSLLDTGLKHLAHIIKRDLHVDVSNVPGSGAAGGLGAGVLAFGNGTLQDGITTILDLVKFDEKLEDADVVITGEGKLDAQSFSGKTISGVAKRALNHNKDVILLVGVSTISLTEAQRHFPNIKAIIETNPLHLPFDDIKEKAPVMYTDAINKLLTLLNVM